MAGKGESVLYTPAAKTAPKQQYLNLLFEAFTQCVMVPANSSIGDIYKKTELLIMITINFIPNKKTRGILKNMREERIGEIETKYKNVKGATSDKNDEIFKANTDILGLIMETCDDFLGIVERQEVIAMADKDKNNDLIKKYYPEGLESPVCGEEGDSEEPIKVVEAVKIKDADFKDGDEK